MNKNLLAICTNHKILNKKIKEMTIFFNLLLILMTLISLLSFISSFQLQKLRIQRKSIVFLSNNLSPERISLKHQLNKLIHRDNLSSEETEYALQLMLSKSMDDATIGAYLSLLRAKGENAQEISGFVKGMLNSCQPVNIHEKLLDIVGTGGDGADTINISTASVVLAAAAGCKVAKAGSRSSSSKCGSADVLEAIGIPIELQPNQVIESIQKCGIGFMFAPINHPAVKHVAPIRKSLGIRTTFNLLGPLTNAARAKRVVIGVFDKNLLDLMADTLIELQSIDHGVIVHGCGLDEISPLGSSDIIEVKATSIHNGKKIYEKTHYNFDPLSVNIPRCQLSDLRGGDPMENAQQFVDVLAGGDYTNAKRDAIILNAGFGIYVYGLTNTITKGIELARETLYSGKASHKLNDWIESTQMINKNSSI